ncbi:MAG: M12 family metallo-peptidase [Acidobacteriota bacterium]|nr:M12 family metallo-peptidase [Acidobacteriota bacterium]
MYTPRNYKVVLLLVAFIAFSGLAVSAQQLVWSENVQDKSYIATDKAVARESFPKEFRLFNLNIVPLREQLFSIVGDDARQQSTIISLPNARGSVELFEVFEASNFEPDLQAQFPEIRAFSGRGITDRYATLKLSISPQGIQTMVFRTDTENEFIEPYSKDHTVYAVFKTQREKGGLPWACSTEERDFFSSWKSDLPSSRDILSLDAPVSNTGQLKTMRLAQSCNGEYSNYFGATNASQVALVLAAFNATLTRANGVYEKDLAIHLNLIASTTNVIYYDPATDPYTTLSAWNGQLQTTLTANIGEANYDIGHMFGASGGGGNAGCIGCVCVDGSKGRGITSPADAIPQGDNFDIDYVVHEVGHQMGANHTFSHSLEGSGNNKEVGSGITIMGYAGITTRDVAPHSIDIFHATSIQQIQNNMANKPCPVTTVMTENHAPVVAPVSNYTIPITTPFALTGSATDAENDPITYTWEQNDNATTSGANSVASPTKLTGPNWLTFPATTSPTRTFPRLSTILAGLAVTPPLPGGDAGANIEALSSVSRTLNFRLTVRDNRPYVPSSTIGQTQFTDMTVTVTNTAGPFKVTAQDSSPTSWQAGSQQTVTWDVANTNLPPVGTANVNILLSTDGGQTFQTVLANTANDGSEQITVPNLPTTTARLKVEAVGNIYFDISNANFTIIAAPVSSAIVAGRVTRSNGQGVSNAIVSLVDGGVGGRRFAITNPFGYYTFENVPTGTSYTVAVVSRLYTFTPQTVQVNGDLNNVNFVANEQ